MNFLRMFLLVVPVVMPAWTQTKPAEANAVPAPTKTIQGRDYFLLRNEALQLTPDKVQQLLTKGQAGDIHAQIVLAMAYQLGSGVPMDASEALKWYHRAFDQGSSIAANQIGVYFDPFEHFAHRKGDDPDEALKWYRMAAEHNDAVGQFNVGALLQQLHREPEAKDWYVKAVESDSWVGAGDLLMLFKRGKAISGQDKKENRRQGLALFQQLAAQEKPGAEFEMGLIYQEGWFDVHRDYPTALSWFTKAAEQGMPRAEYFTGVYNFAGKDVPRNQPEGVKWLLKAADDLEPEAQLRLAFMYENGDGVQKDVISAYMWYMLAAESSAPGTKFPKNARETAHWIRLHHHYSDAEIQEGQRRLHDWKVGHGLEQP